MGLEKATARCAATMCLASAILVSSATLGHALPVKITTNFNNEGLGVVTGDSIAGVGIPELGTRAWFQQTANTATLIAFTLTDVAWTCGNVGDQGRCSVGIKVEVDGLDLAAGWLSELSVDGSVKTTLPYQVGVQAYTFARDSSGYSSLSQGGAVDRYVRPGEFQQSWSGFTYGGVTHVEMHFGVSNLRSFDSFVLPGSMGVAIAAPVTAVPDPGSSLLLLGMGLVGLRAWRKRCQ